MSISKRVSWVSDGSFPKRPLPLHPLPREGEGRQRGQVSQIDLKGLGGRCRWRRLIVIVLWLMLCGPAFVGGTRTALAHATLLESSPPADGLLLAAPSSLRLSFSEQVDTGAGSPLVRVLDESGNDIGAEPAAVTGDDGRTVVVSLPPIAPGTYTVTWTVRSYVDGHTLSGSYAFSVGGGRAPGAATVVGELPASWAVATRWLTFLGAALIAGGFLVAVVIIPGAVSLGRAPLLAMTGALVGLAASAADVVVPTFAPPAGSIAPTLSEAARGLPEAFWARFVALAASLLLVIVWSLTPRIGARLPALEWTGLAVGLVVLLALSMTSHAAARTGTWQYLALASDILHQWAVALWVGGLAHIGLIAWPEWRRTRGGAKRDGRPFADSAIRRFSPLALGLVIIAVVTGVVNTGLALPAVGELWQSAYGRIIWLKVAVLVPALALAIFHRTLLKRQLSGVVAAVRLTLRAETALVLLVVLGGSTLAMLAPPTPEVSGQEVIVLAEPVQTATGGPAMLQLQAQPLEPGVNRFTVTVAGSDGAALSLSPQDLVRLRASSLEEAAIEQAPVDATANGSGGFETKTLALSTDGWWSVEVLLRQAGQQDITATFFLILPDPNLHGVSAVDAGETEPAAEELYQRALTQLTTASSLRYHQVLGGGSGQAVVADYALKEGENGAPSAVEASINSMSLVKIGGREWLRTADAPWRERPGSEAIGPSGLAEQYDGASNIQFGKPTEIDDQSVQIVTFSVDNERYVPAWYVWWINPETGELLREGMVSRNHYMTNTFSDYGAPITIEPPVAAGTPVPVLG